MNIAENIKQVIENNSIAACSVTYMYAMCYNGDRIVFEGKAPKVLEEKRNRDGRRTKCVWQFEDDSKLTFTWSEPRGAKYSTPRKSLFS